MWARSSSNKIDPTHVAIPVKSKGVWKMKTVFDTGYRGIGVVLYEDVIHRSREDPCEDARERTYLGRRADSNYSLKMSRFLNRSSTFHLFDTCDLGRSIQPSHLNRKIFMMIYPKCSQRFTKKRTHLSDPLSPEVPTKDSEHKSNRTLPNMVSAFLCR